MRINRYVDGAIGTSANKQVFWTSKIKLILDGWVEALSLLLFDSGDVTVDLRLITDSNVIVTTPERWDFVSRRWKTRKVLQQIRLLIIDELELLDSDVRMNHSGHITISEILILV